MDYVPESHVINSLPHTLSWASSSSSSSSMTSLSADKEDV
jgi:hypothetical protein